MTTACQKTKRYQALANLELIAPGRGCRIWLPQNDQADRSAIQKITQFLLGKPNPKIKSEILRRHKRVTVYRFHHNNQTYIAKTFTLKRFKDKRHHGRFALAEFTNQQAAQKLNIPVPRYNAYFEKSILSGTFVSFCGVIMQDLSPEYIPLRQALTPGSAEIINIIPTLTDLCRKGINHIDLSPDNIFINDRRQIKIIDWQYCEFFDRPNPNQLLIVSGQFLRSAAIPPHSELWNKWLREMFHQARPNLTFEKFEEQTIRFYRSKYNTDDRLNLNLDHPKSIIELGNP